MAFDPQNATGRTMPAQAPYAPRAAPAVAKFPKVTPPPASPSPTPEAPSSASSDLGPAEGTRVPVAFSVPAAIPASTAPTTAETLPFGSLSDRECAFVYLLRDIDQVISLGTLSPFERAAMAGAKVMFDHLSAECERMLARKVSDLVGPAPELAAEPVSASSETVAAASDSTKDTPGVGPVPSSGVEPAGAGGSLTERLARLENWLEQLVQLIGQRPL